MPSTAGYDPEHYVADIVIGANNDTRYDDLRAAVLDHHRTLAALADQHDGTDRGVAYHNAAVNAGFVLERFPALPAR